MKGLGLIFKIFQEFWKFDDFSMFYSYLNIGHFRIFEKVKKSEICYDFKKSELLQKLIFSIFFCKTFSSKLNLKNVGFTFLISALEQKLWLRTCPQIFDFSDFCPKSCIKSLRKIPKNRKFQKWVRQKSVFKELFLC